MGELRDGLNRLTTELGIPFESAVALLYAESGLNPKARNPKDATKPAVAVGLNQLTTGANLPGFKTSEDLETVLRMSIPEQFDKVVIPFLARMHTSVNGASPGKLRMLNFLSSHANDPLDTVLATKGSEGDWIYRGNPGFDSDGKGYITIKDVYDNTERARVAGLKALDSLDAAYSKPVKPLAEASGSIDTAPVTVEDAVESVDASTPDGAGIGTRALPGASKAAIIMGALAATVFGAYALWRGARKGHPS